MLVDNTLFGVKNKVNIAITLLREFEPEEGYYVAFSGGKDSIVIKDLVQRAGVKYDIHYQNTTIDPPELTAYIRKYHPDVEQSFPKRPYFQEIVRRGFPIRQQRWCCEFLKEYGGQYRKVVTGIRAEESYRRAKRRQVEACVKQSKWFVHPIIQWTEQDVRDYIKAKSLPYCELYDRGFKRIGCVMCPMHTIKRRKEEYYQYPRIARAYEKAFNALYEKNHEREAYSRWNSGEEMFWWWLTNKTPDEPLPLFA